MKLCLLSYFHEFTIKSFIRTFYWTKRAEVRTLLNAVTQFCKAKIQFFFIYITTFKTVLVGMFLSNVNHYDDKLTCGGHLCLNSTNLSIGKIGWSAAKHNKPSVNDYCFFAAFQCFGFVFLSQRALEQVRFFFG